MTAVIRPEKHSPGTAGFLASVLDGLSAHIAVIDETGTILLVNRPWRYFAEQNGIPAEHVSEGVNYLQVCETATGETAQGARQFAEGIRQVFSGERDSYIQEYPCTTPEKTFWFTGIVSPLTAGTQRCVIIRHEDITDRKLAEEKLRHSEERYRLLTGKAHDAIIIVDADGRITSWNPAAEKIFGYSAEEILGQSFLKLSPEKSHPRALAGLQKLLAAGKRAPTKPGIGPARRKDGAEIIIEHTTSCITTEKGSFAFSIARDITERVRADEALRTSQRRLQAILDNIPEMIMQIDREYRIEWANKAALQMNPAAVGNPCHTAFPHKDRPCKNCPVACCFATGQIATTSVHHNALEGLSGESWWQTTAVPVRNEHGEIVGAIEIGRNDTERRQLEENLRQAQKMESLGTLTGGVAHEFNNILGGLIGYAEVAQDTVEEDHPAAEVLDKILLLGTRAADIIRQMLAFSRKCAVNKTEQMLHPTLKEQLKMLRNIIPATIRIKTAIDEDAGTVLADATQMQQIVMNLCSNAVHAMEETGGVLTISLAPVQLDAAAVQSLPPLSPGPHVQLTIGDTGPGIDRAVLERIFDPFFTTKDPNRGTGLGLSVVDGIVREHGGAITVKSTPGTGTIFTVLLPIVEPAAEAARRKNGVVPRGTEQVLLVDDEEHIVSPMKRSMEKLGYTVTALTDSIQTLQRFRADPHAFDIIITDLTMPGMTGRELTAQIRQTRPDMPVVLMTGYNDRDDIAGVKPNARTAVVSKPCRKNDLARTIRSVLDGT